MMTDIEVSRLVGGAHRVSNAPDKLDTEFLGRAQGSVARFIFGSKQAPAVAARSLVSAGLVSPKDPMAVALQEEGPARAATDMIEPAAMAKSVGERAEQISEASGDRSVRVGTAALRRKLSQGRMSHQAAAMGLESIVRSAEKIGDHKAAALAGETFASVAFAGVEARDRVRVAPTKASGRELD